MLSHLRIKIALFSAYFVFAILLNSVGTVIMQSINSFGASEADASLLEAFKDLPIAVVSFLVASWLPKFGYRQGMIVAFSVVALACLAMPLAPSFLMTKLVFVAIGSSFGVTKIAVYATIGLVTESRNEHASFMNFIEGFFMIGMWSGYWIFGAFIDSSNPASYSWLNVYWLLAGLSAANIFLLLGTHFDQAASVPAGADALSEFIAMMKLVWRPLVLIFVLAAFLYVLIEQGIGTWLPTFNLKVLDLPAAMSAQITSIFAGGLAIGRLSAGFLLARMSWYPLLNVCVVAMAMLILAVMPFAAPASHGAEITWFNAPPAAYLLPLIGLFMAPIYPVVNSVVLSALPKERHAHMAGLIVVFSALGGTTGSRITGLTFEHFGGETAFYLPLIPMAVILVCLYLLHREVIKAG
ncbi:MAG: sugar MFS transporter [Parvularculaceae bacterium]